MVTPAAGCEAVAHLRGGFAMSERRVRRVVAVDRSSVRYWHRRCDDNRLRERLKALAEERRWFGDRRLWVLCGASVIRSTASGFTGCTKKSG